MKAHSVAFGLLGAMALLIVCFVISALESRDVVMDETYTAYEDCVTVQYSSTPSAFMIEHGYYPECGTVVSK